MKSTARLAIFIAISLALIACGGNGESTNEDDVKAHYATMAYAAYTDSLSTAQSLSAAIETFAADPTDENLSLAKAAYKAARIPYQQSEIMRWDTAITLENDLAADGGPSSVDDWEGQVNAWPLDEGHIDEIIASDTIINKALLIEQNGANNNEANVTTGVHAIEFMLWGRDTNGTEAGAGERPAVDFALGENCLDNLCERRRQYLQVATSLLVDDLTEMQSEWTPEARATSGTLAYNFLNSDQALDYIVGSIRAMASDELASARMSSGLELGDPEEEHDCFSDLSHVAIFYNFQGVKNAFLGEYQTLSGPSIGDLIRERNGELYAEIYLSLNDIDTMMRHILDAGERDVNTVRYDQIIGQDATGIERQIAEAAVDALINIDAQFRAAQELLSLDDINIGGSGD